MTFRYLSNRIHLWLGFILALPLVLLGLSGSILTARWALDYRLNADFYRSMASHGQVNWDRLLRTARDRSGGSRVTMLRINPTGHGTILAHTTDERIIHLDPGTGRSTGIRHQDDWRCLIWWIQSFHTNFYLGSWGPVVVSTVTLVSTLSLITGGILWLIPLGKPTVSRFGIRWTRGALQTNWDFHNALGFYTLPVVLMIVVTGTGIGFWGTIGPVLHGLAGSDPLRFESPAVTPGGSEYSLERAVRSAREAWPGSNLRRIVIPKDPSRALRMRFETPRAPYEPGLSWIWVNPYSGAVLRQHRPENRSTVDSIYLWLFPLHFGGWGHQWGERLQLVTRTLWVVGSLSPAFLSITGLLIWGFKGSS